MENSFIHSRFAKCVLDNAHVKNPRGIANIIKFQYPNIYEFINSTYTGVNWAERVYKHVHGQHFCPVSGKPTVFITYKRGYCQYASVKDIPDSVRKKASKTRKCTMIERYGVETPLQHPQFSEKIRDLHARGHYNYDVMDGKRRRTLKTKYGSETYNNTDKNKRTKLERYGDETYSNREKFVETVTDRYGPDYLRDCGKRLKRYTQSHDAGFSSEKYKSWLANQNVQNASQLNHIKHKKSRRAIDKMWQNMVSGSRLVSCSILSTKNEYVGVEGVYRFLCHVCENEFIGSVYGGANPVCTHCYPVSDGSVVERQVFEYVSSLYTDEIIRNDRTVLNGKELDIYVPGKNLAIEVDGAYFHAERSGCKPKWYHVLKTELCESKMIDLIHIFDYEWISKRTICESIIASKFNVFERVVHARKCEVIELDSATCNAFLTENHLQGKTNASIRLGLIHDDELVSVMTFGKSRFEQSFEYELHRYVTKMNCKVHGGASKLFSNFIQRYEPRSVVSYSDRRWFDGKVYSALGFTYDSVTPPGYLYTRNYSTFYSRQKFQKHKLCDVLETFDPSKSEWENMQANGYDRIWDCGNTKWILKL